MDDKKAAAEPIVVRKWHVRVGSRADYASLVRLTEDGAAPALVSRLCFVPYSP